MYIMTGISKAPFLLLSKAFSLPCREVHMPWSVICHFLSSFRVRGLNRRNCIRLTIQAVRLIAVRKVVLGGTGMLAQVETCLIPQLRTYRAGRESLVIAKQKDGSDVCLSYASLGQGRLMRKRRTQLVVCFVLLLTVLVQLMIRQSLRTTFSKRIHLGILWIYRLRMSVDHLYTVCAKMLQITQPICTVRCPSCTEPIVRRFSGIGSF